MSGQRCDFANRGGGGARCVLPAGHLGVHQGQPREAIEIADTHPERPAVEDDRTAERLRQAERIISKLVVLVRSCHDDLSPEHLGRAQEVEAEVSRYTCRMGEYT